MPSLLWYDQFFPYLCVDDSELDSRLEQCEDEISGNVEPDEAEAQSEPATAGGIGENDVEADAAEVPVVLRRSSRLVSTQPAAGRGQPPQKKQRPDEGQTKVATAAGFLICVYAYLASIPVSFKGDANASKCFVNIFQQFKPSRKKDRVSDPGDQTRSQLKAGNFPAPDRQSNETEESFLTRVAGYAVFTDTVCRSNSLTLCVGRTVTHGQIIQVT